jgi:hypothetical protein
MTFEYEYNSFISFYSWNEKLIISNKKKKIYFLKDKMSNKPFYKSVMKAYKYYTIYIF